MSIETPSWKTGAAQASVSRRAIVLRVDGHRRRPRPRPRAAARSGRRRLRGCRRRARLDVLRDDAPVGSGAGQRGEVDPALARDPARQRRGLDPPACRASRPGARRRRRCRRGRFRSALAASAAEPAAAAADGSCRLGLCARASQLAPRSAERSSPSFPISAIVEPTSTSPSATTIFSRTPSRSDSTSCVTLSVSSS